MAPPVFRRAISAPTGSIDIDLSAMMNLLCRRPSMPPSASQLAAALYCNPAAATLKTCHASARTFVQPHSSSTKCLGATMQISDQGLCHNDLSLESFTAEVHSFMLDPTFGPLLAQALDLAEDLECSWSKSSLSASSGALGSDDEESTMCRRLEALGTQQPADDEESLMCRRLEALGTQQPAGDAPVSASSFVHDEDHLASKAEGLACDAEGPADEAEYATAFSEESLFVGQDEYLQATIAVAAADIPQGTSPQEACAGEERHHKMQRCS